MPAQPSPTLFFDTINAFQRSATLKAAIELGLFTAIGSSPKTADEIAKSCRIAQRGARILSDDLGTRGFLTKEADRYALTPDSAMFLDQKSPAYVGAAVEFLDSPHIRDCFDALPDRVRAGGAPLSRDSVLNPDHDAWVKFARGMAGLQTMPAKLLAAHIMASYPNNPPLKILDVAAGHGMFGIALLQHDPNATVTGQDWPSVLEVAKEHAGKLHVIDRYQLLPGSAFEVDLGSDYDIILVPNLLHHFDEQANTILLKRFRAALKPGGRIVILEFVPDDNRITPEIPARFSLVMLATTPAGDAYTFAELKRMLEAADFKNISMSDLPSMPSRVISATRS
jgi:ubiquinone/menaquinone biosynthesis C-methylase UbiE